MNQPSTQHPLKLEGRRVLVTGAGTGLGREIALEAARQGANVALHYVHEVEGAESAADQIREMGRRATTLQADFRSLDDARRMTEQAIEFLGGLDSLVNNAGVTMNKPFEQVTPEQYDTLYEVNVRAPFFITQAALPALLASKGTVVNLASIHAYQGFPQHSAYAGTKGAMVAFTRELGVELAMQGVRVNAIAPGATAVENYWKIYPNYDKEAAGENIPCGFVGDPIDIARVAAFLMSSDSRYIVGQTLIVDGGTTSWMPFNNSFRDPLTVQFGVGYVPGL